MDGTGKAEGYLMPENNTSGKRFCSLDVNLGFGLNGGDKRCLHIEWRQVFEQQTDSGGELGFGLALLTLLR